MDKMDPDDLFKRFFGSSPLFGEFKYRGYGHGHEDMDQWSGGGGTGEDVFSDWHKEFHKQLEEMDHQMQDVFRIFRISELPAIPALPHGQTQEHPGKRNPRDFMLKDGGGESIITPPIHRESDAESPSVAVPSRPRDEMSTLFENFFNVPRWNRIRPQDKKDTDLDEESPNGAEIADLFKGGGEAQRPVKDPSQSRPFSFFSRNSVSIKTVIGPDGVMEERRTVRDSSGREETTVTRRIGDSSHSVTTVKDETGRVEKCETFENVDKDKLSDFDRHWGGQQALTAHEQDSQILLKDPSFQPVKPLFDDTRNIFRRLFGFSSK